MKVPVFAGSKTGTFLKNTDKMAVGIKCQIVRDVHRRIIGILEHIFRSLDAFIPDEMSDGSMHFFLEQPAEISGVFLRTFCQIVNGNRFMQMVIDIIYALDDRK